MKGKASSIFALSAVLTIIVALVALAGTELALFQPASDTWQVIPTPPEVTLDDVMPSPEGTMLFLLTSDPDTNTSTLWQSPVPVTAGSWVAGTLEESGTLHYAFGSRVYTSLDYGATWLSADAGIGTIFMIAMAPAYPVLPAAWHVLVGGTEGAASYSTDGGATFTSLPSLPVGGNVQIAADTDYANNNTIYAGSSNGNVYRYVIGTSTVWEDINATITNVSGLVVCSGALYAADATPGGGVYLTYNPTAAMPDWEHLTNGLSGGETFNQVPSALRCSTDGDGNVTLFAIDTANNLLYQYTEAAARGVLWPWIVLLIIVTAGGGVLVKKTLDNRAKKIAREKIKTRLRRDIGTQQIKAKKPIKIDFEIRLRPVSDPGRQDIETEGPLIRDEEEEKS
jgi:hypothetical protein